MPPRRDLVSCIMPTSDRRAYVPNAIRYFLQQDYSHRELIVVDDGEEPVADLIPKDARIRYHRLAKKHTVGAKRNIACEMARGPWIAHWDDDDWHAPWRLSYQVSRMRAGSWDLCGLASLYFLDADAERAWQYVYPGHARPWVAGGTLFYRKSFWQACPFRDIDVGEDALFVWRHPTPRVKKLRDSRFYVALIHGGNTSPKHTRGSCWQQIDPKPVRALVGPSWPQPEPSPLAPLTTAVEPPQEEKVIVSIPYFACRPYIRRAVTSILAQTYRNLLVVVTNDGDSPPWDLLADIQDPRLIRFDLKQNRGRYFADGVVLEAAARAGIPYFMVQDADDWSEPDRLARLLTRLKAEDAGGAVSANWTHLGQADTAQNVEVVGNLEAPLGMRMEHRVNHYGLFRVDALKAIGGYYAGFRVGYDTLLINFLLMTSGLAAEPAPLYHRAMRADSLTSSTATGMRSSLRRQTARKLAEMYAEALARHRQYLLGEWDQPELRAAIRAICARATPAGAATALARAADSLHNLVNESLRGAESRKVPYETAIDLEDPRLTWSDWTLNQTTVRELRRHLETHKPKRIVETGSGLSTLFLAEYCRAHGAELVALEHDSVYHRRTRDLLVQFQLEDRVDLRLADLRPHACPGGQGYAWYDTVLEGLFDFALIDGPPLRHGRQAVLFALAPHLAPGWSAWLDDANRDHEQACLQLWRDHLPTLNFTCQSAGKGLAKMGEAFIREPLGEKLAITLLTGGRPHLLRETLARFEAHFPQVLKQSPVIAMVNGYDPEALAFLQAQPYVDQIQSHLGEPFAIGEAVSRLMAEVQALGGVEVVLHLEDDWLADGEDRDWLHRGLTMLRAHPHVGQIRLRRNREKTLPNHMITGRPIHWQRHCGFHLASSAHFTFNPSLVRVADLDKIFPCDSEQQAQRHFLETGLATIQLVPGVFRHGGEHCSRRLALGR